MSKWISVKDRLPNHHDMVLVWMEGKDCPDYVSMAFWAKTEGWGWTKGDGNKANDLWGTVTHWMPLPEPPEAAHE